MSWPARGWHQPRNEAGAPPCGVQPAAVRGWARSAAGACGDGRFGRATALGERQPFACETVAAATSFTDTQCSELTEPGLPALHGGGREARDECAPSHVDSSVVRLKGVPRHPSAAGWRATRRSPGVGGKHVSCATGYTSTPARNRLHVNPRVVRLKGVPRHPPPAGGGGFFAAIERSRASCR
jgi:hypothetical protein